jgi:metallo-beta-lactamase class B
MLKRFAGAAALFDPQGCKTYAAALTSRLDERLAKEGAGK